MLLRWSSLRVDGHRRFCASLPDGRIAYVEPSPITGGWRARIVKHAGATTPDTFAVRPTATAARAWVDDRYDSATLSRRTA